MIVEITLRAFIMYFAAVQLCLANPDIDADVSIPSKPVWPAHTDFTAGTPGIEPMLPGENEKIKYEPWPDGEDEGEGVEL